MANQNPDILQTDPAPSSISWNTTLPPDIACLSPYEYTALSPLDGRYRKVGDALKPFFSEFALARRRTQVEIEWLIYLLFTLPETQLPESFLPLPSELDCRALRDLYRRFDGHSFAAIKALERQTNHDVKSVELFIAERMRLLGLERFRSYIHIGCTSEDINNLAYALNLSDAMKFIWEPQAQRVIDRLGQMAMEYSDLPMLGHTHGQPATPTTVGKELRVYSHRLTRWLRLIQDIVPQVKFNGATGNYAAIQMAFPEENWEMRVTQFLWQFEVGVELNPLTTQIESHDWICQLLDGVRQFNNVIRNLAKDMSLYTSMNYFLQIPKREEVGSSTMPQKINPIKFENCEAHTELSNGNLLVLSSELPLSRLQRDLTDSALLRYLGEGLGLSLQALDQMLRGLQIIVPNREVLAADLNAHWEVLAEAVQTVMRKHGIADAYEQLKEFTRGQRISQQSMHDFIAQLDLPPEDKGRLLHLTPKRYTGYAAELAQAGDAYED